MSDIQTFKNIYLEKNLFDFKNFIITSKFPWYFSPHQTMTAKDTGFFGHNFYANHSFCSPHIDLIAPLLEFINPTSILNIRLNFLINRKDSYCSSFHTDSYNNQLNHTTAIFYVNTNNGYTEFEDGTKILSEENKLITFPAHKKHRACSQTDKPYRVVVNLNYFK